MISFVCFWHSQLLICRISSWLILYLYILRIYSNGTVFTGNEDHFSPEKHYIFTYIITLSYFHYIFFFTRKKDKNYLIFSHGDLGRNWCRESCRCCTTLFFFCLKTITWTDKPRLRARNSQLCCFYTNSFPPLYLIC